MKKAGLTVVAYWGMKWFVKLRVDEKWADRWVQNKIVPQGWPYSVRRISL